MEGYWKFQMGGEYEAKLEFPEEWWGGGGGIKPKNHPWEEYEYGFNNVDKSLKSLLWTAKKKKVPTSHLCIDCKYPAWL